MDIQTILAELNTLIQHVTFHFVNIDVAENQLKDIERKLNSVPQDDWQAIRLNNTEELVKLKLNLNYLLKEPTIRANNRIFIGFRDRYNGRMFENIQIINETKIVTNTFNEFIRGITYFTADPPGTLHNDPLYHRNVSCPPKNTPNVVCDPSGMTHEDLKKRMQKCYIERLIYDEIWFQLHSMQQNIGHLRWLEDTKIAFQKCFPHMTISVVVRIIDRIPDRVVITIQDTTDTNSENVIVELYEKDYSFTDHRYDTIIRGTHMVNKQIVAVKMNTCSNEGEWHSITPQINGQVPGGSHKKLKDSIHSVITKIIKTRNKIKRDILKNM
jgi:hypothetical protein